MYNTFLNLEMQKLSPHEKQNLSFSVSGGGRLIHTFKDNIKDIMLFGHSVPYGKADHEKVHYILKTELEGKGYKIRWSNST